MTCQTKADEIIFLEKQGLCSQKLRTNLTGNLAEVTKSFVGQNMNDISNIDNNNLIKVELISLFSFDNYLFYFLFQSLIETHQNKIHKYYYTNKHYFGTNFKLDLKK